MHRADLFCMADGAQMTSKYQRERDRKRREHQREKQAKRRADNQADRYQVRHPAIIDDDTEEAIHGER